MTKPIEWTEVSDTTTRTTLHKEWRVTVERGGKTVLLGGGNDPATPSDLASALAAMGEGERAEVLGAALPDERVARREWVDETRVIIRALPTESIQDAARRVVRERDEGREALRRAHELCSEVTQARTQKERECATTTARAERAERERDEARSRNEQRDRDWDVIRTLTDAGADFTVAAVRRVVSERDEFRDCMGAVADQRTAETLRANRAEKLLSEVRGERDDLRVKNDGLRDCLKERKTICEDAIKRAIAAETAAAQREPGEYPLAEGSRWEGETIAANGVSVYISTGRLWLLSGVVAMSAEVPDVLALAHRRGLL